MGDIKDAAVLVTGAAGFVGSHLCERLLAAGRRVVGLGGGAATGVCAAPRGRSNPPGSEPEFHCMEIGLRPRFQNGRFFRAERAIKAAATPMLATILGFSL